MAKDLLSEGSIFGLGNPLLDITANVSDEFIQKYDLPKNGAVVAAKKHENLYEELINNFEIDYSAGGATQNTLRFVQWIIGKNKPVATFLGCVGDDYFGRMMEKKAKSDGVKVLYEKDPNTATGTCAVLVTDHGASRSLCAYLGAAEKFTKEHLIRNWHWVEKARVFYCSGHALSVSAESVVSVAHQTVSDKFTNKKMLFNLAATYVSEKFGSQLMEVLPYVDFLFGNEDECKAYAKMRGTEPTDMKAVAKLMANEEKKSPGKRVAVVTQGSKPVLVCTQGSDKIEEYPVPQLDDEKIVDTNGAGDAFTGGFLAMYIQDKPLDVCLKCAIYCATECIQRLGCTFPREFKFKP